MHYGGDLDVTLHTPRRMPRAILLHSSGTLTCTQVLEADVHEHTLNSKVGSERVPLQRFQQ